MKGAEVIRLNRKQKKRLRRLLKESDAPVFDLSEMGKGGSLYVGEMDDDHRLLTCGYINADGKYRGFRGIDQ